jgi:hypothetical protein
MKATQLLHEFGQSIWSDNITRDLRIIPELESEAEPNLNHRRMKEEL